MPFSKNVFVNCPFDDEYQTRLLQPLLFTIVYLGFNPRIASETIDSGAPRIAKIYKLIEESKFAIHDLSRLKASKKGEYFRLNMPFELGLDAGCRHFKEGKWQRKVCLILVAEKYQHQAALSDISGSDTQVHKNDPADAVKQVRNWLNNHTGSTFEGPQIIWKNFNVFQYAMRKDLMVKGEAKQDIDNMPTDELIRRMEKWIATKRK